MDFEKLINNEAFQQAAAEVKSIEELHVLLKDYGVDVSKEEIEAAVASVSAEGSLNEDDLKTVSGGILLPVGIGIKVLLQRLKTTIKNGIYFV